MNKATEMACDLLLDNFPNMTAEFGDHALASDQREVIRSFAEAAVKNLDDHRAEIDFGEIFRHLSVDFNDFAWRLLYEPDGKTLIGKFVEWDMVGDPMSRENIAAILWKEKGIAFGGMAMNGCRDFECLLCDGGEHWNDRFEIFDREGRLIAKSALEPLITLPLEEVSKIADERAAMSFAREQGRRIVAGESVGRQTQCPERKLAQEIRQKGPKC